MGVWTTVATGLAKVFGMEVLASELKLYKRMVASRDDLLVKREEQIEHRDKLIELLKEQHEKDTETIGVFCDVLDALHDDPQWTEVHGYGKDPVGFASALRRRVDQLEERVSTLVAEANKRAAEDIRVDTPPSPYET